MLQDGESGERGVALDSTRRYSAISYSLQVQMTLVLLLAYLIGTVLGEGLYVEDWLDEEKDCPLDGAPWIRQIQIPWGAEHRAHRTIPEDLFVIKQSTILGAGMGAFAAEFIPKWTWLAEYEGEIVKSDKYISDYAWQIWRDDEMSYLVDAGDIKTSNWIRWINCARHSLEENVAMYECCGKVYYMTIENIYPGRELLVYYGDGYAKDLGIDTDKFQQG